MTFRDRVASFPEGEKELAEISITLLSNGKIGLWINPKGDDIKASGDATVKFLLEDYILTGIAIIKEIWQGNVEDWVEMVDKLMELWSRQAQWWDELTQEEKEKVLSKDEDEEWN